jgi:hypothetical protein
MSGTFPQTIGIIANPLAGTDVRRLSSPAGHTSNAAKVAIIQRVAAAAAEAGAQRILVAADAGGLGQRAVSLLGAHVELLDQPVGGTRRDTVEAARLMWKAECSVVVVLGGDGTCRDAAIGWPQLPIIALSTGTNNVFPSMIDPVAAGTAAGLIAAGRIQLDAVSSPSKRLVVHVGESEYCALVDVAVLHAGTVGSRAVLNANDILAVVAAVSSPMASGMSAVAGRVCPLADDDPDGVVVHLGGLHLGDSPRHVRIPLVPGRFATVAVRSVARLPRGDVARFEGPAVLAFDGERDVVAARGERIAVSIDHGGPLRIDVNRVLHLAAHRGAFDIEEDRHGS